VWKYAKEWSEECWSVEGGDKCFNGNKLCDYQVEHMPLPTSTHLQECEVFKSSLEIT
jgi:hypothetical protein